jgi:hypothetical protein
MNCDAIGMLKALLISFSNFSKKGFVMIKDS